MPTYITMLRWTAEGARDVKKSPSRLDAAKKGFAQSGVTMRAFYMTTGRYDMIAICEAPDDTAVAKAMLSTLGGGSVKTETMRAFTRTTRRTEPGSQPCTGRIRAGVRQLEGQTCARSGIVGARIVR